MSRKDRCLTEHAADRLMRDLRKQFQEKMTEIIPPTPHTTKRVVGWVDREDHMHSLRVEPYVQPTPEDPECPLILRVSINKYALENDPDMVKRMRWGHRRPVEPSDPAWWTFQMFILPEELQDFCRWFASLVGSRLWSHKYKVSDPPHPCHFCGETPEPKACACTLKVREMHWGCIKEAREEILDKVGDGPIRRKPYVRNTQVSGPRAKSAPQEAAWEMARLKREFYQAIVDHMEIPVIRSHRPNAVCWLDPDRCLNHLVVLPHCSPCKEALDWPLIPRIHVNHYYLDHKKGIARRAGWLRDGSCCPSREPQWTLELSTLPRELLAFAPWLAKLALAHAQGRDSFDVRPPHRCPFEPNGVMHCQYTWTTAAGHLITAAEKREEERVQALKMRREERARLREAHVNTCQGGAQ